MDFTEACAICYGSRQHKRIGETVRSIAHFKVQIDIDLVPRVVDPQ